MNNKKLNTFMKKLNKQLKQRIFIGTAEAYNNEIKKYFSNHPRGIGITLSHFNQKKLVVNIHTTL